VRITPWGDAVETYRGAGCETCFGTGYIGRVGIFEMMEINEEIRRKIMTGDDSAELTSAAKRNGMRTLREDGWLKVADGVTTADEVLRVTQEF
jgi:type II secretory ATPase GspE/PulE/Tfp pilus assembly ATPase PilB-like protein